MEILRTPAALRAWRTGLEGQVGLVPTMGYLHDGHMSLVARCVEENDVATASLFVNPTQFGKGEDFGTYPRDEARDFEMFESAGIVAVYAPSVEAMYPGGFGTTVQPGAVAEPLEGASRPGHFVGVTTVVAKLFNGVQPHRAYFGKKDAQQLRVIRAMVRDLDMAVEIIGCPIVREPDGLAMSSRNVYLTPEERKAAPVVYRALTAAQDAYLTGEHESARLRELFRRAIAGEPLAELDYVSIADDVTLAEVNVKIERRAVLSTAVRFGRTRLIDNVELGI
ncbi:MAG: pantoate--beta-alanine ligase [Dehalococcoidia bacterium]|nr:pantoate--beta-alanine ligase [Dehalococcoidia bacterium]